MKPHRVLIAAFAPVQLLDVSGPIDVLSLANELGAADGAPLYEIVLAVPQAGMLMSSSGIALHAPRSLYGRALQADTLLLAGGSGARAAVADTALVTRLRRLCAATERVGSICTGAFPLAATGLLDGGRATTHWAHIDALSRQFPRVRVERDALFVAEGKYHSSAGISAGIDYALALVERDHGRELALAVARQMVVFLRRPGGQSQFSAELAAETQAPDPQRFAQLTGWMRNNLRADLSVQALAARSAMSERNFARRFGEAMGVAPGHYVQTLRLDCARRLLTGTSLSIARVAERSGFGSDESMRQCFVRHLNVAPSEFRARFRSTVAR